MKQETMNYCNMLIQNRNVFREAFMWEDGLSCLAGAGIFTKGDQMADADTLKSCKKILSQKVGMFSNFAGVARIPVVAMLAASDRPEQLMAQGLEIYKRLKKDFIGSPYLPLAAMMIAQMTEEESYEKMAVRTRTLYKRMKEEHPFLTKSEDSPLCALLAFSEKTDDALIFDMEKCYDLLKNEFFSGNAVQSLTHVLSLFEEPAELKCEKTMQLFHALKDAGRKYGTNYELPTLGVLAMTQVPVKEIVQEIIEIEEWLSKQKGFGLWSNVTQKQRRMYAGMLAQKDYIKVDAIQTTAVSSALTMVLAQEITLCVIVAGSVAATSSASSNN